ncbi:hypothetical protein [Ensifer sp. Root278]|uniref:hypothetical protein n=1 Tax=Ensifer sp. Root278 TaxID=1736509 RepID=UPI00070B74A9|nr:hypothetical protein [Ensifer sp. Root278]KRD62100.1 hypothetical protein ASE60_32050 [Ensifer sp. Root278]
MEKRNDSEKVPEGLETEAQARRDFLKKAGRFAVVTPPAITLLLGTSLSSRAIAKSRRDFLKKAGRFAVVTPPAITLLLGTSLSSRAIAKSSGTRPGWGFGDKNHTHNGPPGLWKRFGG